MLYGTVREKRARYLTKDLEAKLYSIMNGIFSEARSFFNRYNFTVDEASPMEVEVSVDPLLLGTVLENMLPEHERGNKGTFYTPPNEIGFMCRRASTWLGIEERVEVLPDGSMRFIDGLSEFMARATGDIHALHNVELKLLEGGGQAWNDNLGQLTSDRLRG
jgi:hypothetical protein